MLYKFLLVLLIIDSFVLIAAILLQSGKGGGLAASFGGAGSSPDAFIGMRQAGNLLTMASWWAGGLFLFLAFVLQIASVRSNAPKSVLDRPFSQQPASQQQAAPSTSAPAVPLAPAAGSAPGAAAPAPTKK